MFGTRGRGRGIEPTLIAAYFKQGCPETRPHKALNRGRFKRAL